MTAYLFRKVVKMADITYNAQNYTEQGGSKTVIGGTVVIEGGIENASGGYLIENQADSVASTVAATVIDLNALLTKLKASGLMAPDA